MEMFKFMKILLDVISSGIVTLVTGQHELKIWFVENSALLLHFTKKFQTNSLS